MPLKKNPFNPLERFAVWLVNTRDNKIEDSYSKVAKQLHVFWGPSQAQGSGQSALLS